MVIILASSRNLDVVFRFSCWDCGMIKIKIKRFLVRFLSRLHREESAACFWKENRYGDLYSVPISYKGRLITTPRQDMVPTPSGRCSLPQICELFYVSTSVFYPRRTWCVSPYAFLLFSLTRPAIFSWYFPSKDMWGTSINGWFFHGVDSISSMIEMCDSNDIPLSQSSDIIKPCPGYHLLRSGSFI